MTALKRFAVAALSFALISCSSEKTASNTNAPDTAAEEAKVRATVAEFYQNFDEGFTKAPDYAAEDWNHISPFGGRDNGLDATMKDVREVHQTFLKGTTDKIEQMDVRFADANAAVATVISVMSPFTDPGGVKHGNERHIRTFVVVKRGERWRIMQDQNTLVVNP